MTAEVELVVTSETRWLRLIRGVVLSPTTQPWKAKAIRAVLERFDSNVAPEFSDLSLSPLHQSVLGRVELGHDRAGEDDQ